MKHLLSHIALTLILVSPKVLFADSPQAMMHIERTHAESDAPLGVGESFNLVITIPEAIANAPNAPSWTFDFLSTTKWVRHGPILLDYYSLGPVENRKTKVIIQAIPISAGKFIIPPITLREEAGKTKLTTNSIDFEIKSVLNTDDKEPIWSLPPLPFGHWNTWVIYSMLGILLLLLASITYYFYRKKIQSHPRKSLSLYQSILAELQRWEGYLSTRNSLESAECKNLSFTLSYSVRKHCGHLIGSNCLELTDGEFIEKIRQKGLRGELVQRIQNMLMAISESRYNKKMLESAAAKNILHTSRDLIMDLEKNFSAPPKAPGD